MGHTHQIRVHGSAMHRVELQLVEAITGTQAVLRHELVPAEAGVVGTFPDVASVREVGIERLQHRQQLFASKLRPLAFRQDHHGFQ